MNIVLLQGPLGPIFQTLANQLIADGHKVFKICFNGGDECWSSNAEQIRFRQHSSTWQAFFSQFCHEQQIDKVICYGDCRFYHRIAAKVCKRQQRQFWALEEGYLRPDYITFEQGGVNANSPLYRQRNHLVLPQTYPAYQHPFVAGKTFGKRAWFACRQHINRLLASLRYPHYVNHRPWRIDQEALGWVKGALIKLKHKAPDARLLAGLKAHNKGRLFLLPLQVSEDFQIRDHANYKDINSVITDVVTSFAKHADSRDSLLIKHHPMDRGFVDYQKLIHSLRKQYQLGERLSYGYELPLPEIYPLLKGVVTVNSTVGLSALLHHVPVKCLGKALYDIKGLTSAMSLAQFWHNPSAVDHQRFEYLRQALLWQTQINASFYADLPHAARRIIERVTEVSEQAELLKKAS
ncbi:capsule biosynthesis protein [Shewanella sp. NIFS-20-20]|uniref:capsule biosynthesis protein n=1 Tax=Shewanella sp. NIFS-20-20 TaxID=2853806 RepID=UPI001C454197|nr:capsular biosynthesis protein [Shewanella sp. NIFS-20-20]MBV7316272.1 capsular biosynthesis protein [Shewanella sp. NIFS-20-20]